MQLHDGDPSEVGVSAEQLEALARRARGWVGEGITPSLVVLAARRGVIVLHEAFGKIGPENDAPVLSLDSLFLAASLTKLFTLTLALMLVDAGRLSPTRPVAAYLPNVVGPGKEKVMVHHLLTHTSGLRDEDVVANIQQKIASGEIQYSAQDRLNPEFALFRWCHTAHACDTPLHTTPGTEMHYCTHNYYLLGQIVETIYGQSLTDVGRERLFDPLGMTDTSYTLPPEKLPRAVRKPVVHLYSGVSEGFLTNDCAFGDCSAYTTAHDVAIFGEMWRQGGCYAGQRLLSTAAVAKATRNQIPGISAHFNQEVFPEASWGWGWDMGGDKQSTRYGSLYSSRTFLHGGANNICLWVDPENEIVGAYFGVTIGLTPGGHALWCADLFANAVTAAIEE